MISKPAQHLHMDIYLNGSDPEYRISGDYKSVQFKVDELFDRYPPAGYGTYITSDVFDLGVRTVRMTRYHSCD